jgi:hypothetical protein
MTISFVMACVAAGCLASRPEAVVRPNGLATPAAGNCIAFKVFGDGGEWRSDMRYTPKDPLTDPPRRPDELRRLNRAQDNSGDGMGLWLVGIIAGLLVVMLVYGYIAPISTTASAPPSRSSATTTGAAPVNPLAATPSPAPAAPVPDNR